MVSSTALAIAGEHRFDRAVAAVAHPALDAGPRRLVLDEGAETDALHPAAEHDVADQRHRNSPILRTSGPSGRVAIQASNARI